MQVDTCMLVPVHGHNIQSSCRSYAANLAGSAVCAERSDFERTLRAAWHDPPGRHTASRAVGGGQSCGHGLAWPREATLSQPDANPRDLRALDQQVRTPSIGGAERAEAQT